MARRAARITHDEVTRIVKAVRDCKLPIERVTYDGERVDVIIGEPNAEDVDKEPEKKPHLEVVNL